MRGLALRAGAASLTAALCAWTAGARAQPPAFRAGVEHGDCPRELGAAVESALDVELSAAAPELRVALADGAVRCALACDASGTTAIVVRGAGRVEQRIDGEGPGLARRLAIVLVELLESTGPPGPDPPLPEPGPGPEPEPERPDGPLAERLLTRLRLAGGVWLGGEPLLALGALEIGVEIAPTQNVALVIGAAGALGALEVDAGHLDVRLLSAAVSLRFGAEAGPFWFGGGPAARGGAASWTGTPSDPTHAVGRDTAGGWLGLGAVAAAFVGFDAVPVRLGVEVEGGGIAHHSGALVLGARAARIGGGWLEVRVAVDLAFE